MNYSPATPLYTSPHGNRRKIVFGVCSVLVLCGVFAVIGGVVLFRAGSQSVTGAQVQADRFLTTLEQSRYAESLQMMTSRTRSSTSLTSIQDIMDFLHKKYGKALSHSQSPGFYINTYNGVTQVRLDYKEKFQKSEQTVQLILSHEQGQWHVAAFNFMF